jgi:putative nucleotidyltransferase with HDIG domain
MSTPATFRRLSIGALVVAIAVATAVFVYFPIDLSRDWILALVTLLGLAILSAYLALTVTPGGASTAVDFLAHLAAIILLGPSGAVLLAIIQQLIIEFGFLKKPALRATFNLAQVVTASAIGGVAYHAFGGSPSLELLQFRQSFPPFIIAVLAYWTTNGVAVSWALSTLERRRPLEVWGQVIGVIIVFDIAMSTLSYLIALMYVMYGPISLLAAIVPMIGLRYSYGVNIQLQQLNQDLLRVLIKTLEARDKYTSGHSERVSQRSRLIATQLGLAGRKIRSIEAGALLHDIGKIDLAYGEILRQAGPLTPEQRELIRAHPDKGVEIVSSVRSLDPQILDCIRHHHEWFDGTGYPTGLSGENIPIGARIIMISDSVDAMMTDRPYRKALSLDEVKKELLRNSGTQFDPLVVEAALDAGVLDHA